MTKLVIRSFVFGFIVGTVFFAVAPLGLTIAFVEFLRPLLIPGIDLFQPLLAKQSGVMNPLVLGLILNGLIYTALLLTSSLIRKYVASSKAKCFAMLLVILAFFAVTGMLTNVYSFLTSPNKSWIFRVGA